MRALKIAGAAIAAVIVVIALLLVIGIPSGFMTSADPGAGRARDRLSGSRSTAATRIGIWPSLNVTLNDVTLQDPKDRDINNRLTAGSVQADMTLASVWSGQPQITELVDRPSGGATCRCCACARSQCRRARPAPSSAGDGEMLSHRACHASPAARIVFSNLRDRVENRIETINAEATIGGDRKIRVTGNARAGEHPLKFEIKAAAPAPPIERQNIPIEFKLDAPGLLQAPLSGKAEVRLNGSVVMINGLTGTLGDGAFNGWASVDIASKPLVKLDLDFQRLDVAMPPRPAAAPRRSSQPWSNATIDLNGLNYVDAQAQDFRRRDQYRRGAFRAGRDRRHARQRRAEGAIRQSRRLWRQANGDLTIDASTAEPDLCAAQPISPACARCRCSRSAGRFRQARRQDAGEDQRALHRQQPARDHVEPRRHRVRGVPGRRDPRPQRRADDPLADLGHAVGMAGGQGAGHRPDAALAPRSRSTRARHDHRSQSGRPAGADDRRRHHRPRHQADRRSGSSRNW